MFKFHSGFGAIIRWIEKGRVSTPSCGVADLPVLSSLSAKAGVAVRCSIRLLHENADTDPLSASKNVQQPRYMCFPNQRQTHQRTSAIFFGLFYCFLSFLLFCDQGTVFRPNTGRKRVEYFMPLLEKRGSYLTQLRHTSTLFYLTASTKNEKLTVYWSGRRREKE